MELNKKSLEILNYLLYKNDFVKIKELADIYNCTDRTMRYTIDKIERFLMKNGFSYLEKQHSKGVKLTAVDSLKKFINTFSGEYIPYSYTHSDKERFNFIITKLLENTEPLKQDFFEKKLYVSKNTISKDIKSIEKWLMNRDMKVVKKPRVGILIEGSEIHRRKALIDLASETIATKDIVNFMNRKITLSKINSLQFDTLFSEIDVNFLDNIIIKSEKNLGREFSDEAYSNLLTHIAIMIKRIQLNQIIYIPEVNIENLNATVEYNIAEKMVAYIEEKYKILVPCEETSYIALHILGAKVIKNSDSMNVMKWKENGLSAVVKIMTEEIEETYNTSFGEKKDKIMEGLVIHLRPSIYRIKYNLKLMNPLLEEIKQKYKELFLNTKCVVRHLETYINSSIDDHEISYIALHFGAALENSKSSRKEKAKIVIVCGTGIGTAKMLASQIEKEFDVEIVDTISSRAAANMNMEKLDFIISTVDIPSFAKEQYIKINPLLMKKDYEILKQKFKMNYGIENNYEMQMQKVNKLISIAEKYCTINDNQQLQYEFMYELLSDNKGPIRRCVYMLNDLLTFDVIKLNVECSSWKEAILEGTSLLEEKGCIEKRYSEAIIDNFNEFGPYMVVAPGIVLSHARPENGVKKLSMSLITLRNEVKFGNETNDPVKLVITLAATDSETHLKALSQLMELFMNSADLNAVMNSTNKEQALEIIKKYSKQ
ncbi:BglG family transcription antiterminator [Clostridium sp.]